MKKKCNFCKKAKRKFKWGILFIIYIILSSVYGTIGFLNLIF
jgi:hypothetical protein